eukprot:195158-Alexandrium_andersonii.AAC.1
MDEAAAPEAPAGRNVPVQGLTSAEHGTPFIAARGASGAARSAAPSARSAETSGFPLSADSKP